jgi:hypothetical protein
MRRVTPPANPHAVHLGSATVVPHFLSIYNIQLALFHWFTFEIGDFRGGSAGLVRMELEQVRAKCNPL